MCFSTQPALLRLFDMSGAELSTTFACELSRQRSEKLALNSYSLFSPDGETMAQTMGMSSQDIGGWTLGFWPGLL